MRRVLLFVVFVFYFSASANAQSPKPATKPVATALTKADAAHPAVPASPLALNAARASFAKLPLAFEENTGQTDSRVKFTSRGAGYNLFLTGDEAVFALRGGSTLAKCSPISAKIHQNCEDSSNKNSNENSVLWMKMLGANASAQVSGTDPLPGKINYYTGNDRSKWRTGVIQYGRVNYRGIYPGVDLTYYGNQQQLESDFILAPGANPRSIEFEVKGARESRLDAQGNLVLATSAGNVQLLRPGIYQVIDGKRREVSGRYVMRSQNRIGFAVGAYNTHEKLIIDPTLVYSTFLGGSSLSSGDGAQSIAIDSTGHAYVTGQGTTADFPGSDPSGPPISELSDFVFVTEFDPTGSSAGASLVYSTILSGRSGNSTIGNGIGVDASGNAYVAGNTSASDFPMVNPFQSTFGSPSQTGFVAGLAAATGTLNYSTYFGGRNSSDTSEIQNLFADAAGNVYVVGDTSSPNFPTVNPLQATLNGFQNVVVAKFSSQGQPVYSTYLGGNSSDSGTAIAADGAGNAYITGFTTSANFPVQSSPAPFQSTLKGFPNVFVSKLSFTGSTMSLAASTYLGGSGGDQGLGVAVDTATPPNVYVTGQTDSSGAAPNGFPTTSGAFSTADALDAKNNPTTDAFVTKLKGDFTALTYSTYLGGSGTDIGNAIGIDATGNAYITGSTTSANFPTKLPLQSAIGGASATNVFLTELNTTGTALVYSTYLGGTAIDNALGIAVDSTGNAYIAGKTTSANFPVLSGGAAGTNPFQGQLGGSAGNAFVAKISPAAAPSALNFFPPSYNFHDDGIGASGTETVTLSNNSSATASVSGFAFGGANSGDFTLSAATAPCLTSGSFSLLAGASCTVTIKFAPTDQDARSANLTATYNSTSTAVMNLTGSGGAPEVSLSTTSINFGSDPLNVQDVFSVSIINTGGAPLQLGSAQLSAPTPANAAPYSIQTASSGCFTAPIAPGSGCSFEIFFVPTAAGTFNASVLVNSNAAGSPATVTLTGIGVQEVLVQPTTLELGVQIVGSSATDNESEASLINGSGEPLTITVTPGTGADQGDFQLINLGISNSCSTVGTLAPGGTCALGVLFQPKAVSATDGRTGSFTIGWAGTAIPSLVPSSKVVNVMGTGITGISLSTNSITGPNEFVGFTEGSAGLEILANGTPNLITVSIALSGNNPGDFTAALDPTCAPGGVVPAQTYCHVELTFTPSAIGLRTATAAFNYTGVSSGQLLLSLNGTGIPGPVVISTTANGFQQQISSFDFGSEIISTTTPEKMFLVRNVATVPLTVQSMTGPTNTDFKITPDSSCTSAKTPLTIPGGGSCVFGVTFTPSTTGSKESTTMVITDAYTSTSGVDASSPHTLTLTGTGEPAAITVSVSSGGTSLLDFGNVQINPSPVPQAAIYLTNAGNSSTSIPTGGAPVLSVSGSSTFGLITTGTGANLTTCTQGKVILPQGGNCLIGVTFTPTVAGLQTSSVTFSDTLGGSHTVNIQGTGVGQGKLSLSLALPQVTFQVVTFNQLEGTTSSTQSVTVANLGNGPLTITSLPTFGTNVSNFTTLPSSTCAVGLVLPSGSSGNTCVFNFTFTAPATPGNSSEDLEVLANLGNNASGSLFIELSGNSVAGGFSLSPAAPINIGAVAVGTTADSNFYTLTNNNATSVTFGAVSFPTPTGYSTLSDGCSNTVLTAANSCNFEISFTPPTAGSFNGNLSFPYTGAAGSPFNIAVQASGSTAVVANPNPLNFQFASAGNPNLSSLNITNGSTSAATITGVSSITGTNSANFSIPAGDNFCPNATVLTPSGGSCFIEVQFLSAVAGNFTAQFTVSYTIGGIAQTPVTVVLNASIPFSLVTVAPNPVVFPSQTVNTQSQTINVTLSNSASATQTMFINTAQISGNDFSLASPGTGNCFNVTAGTSCTIPIAFTPSAAGARTGTLTITDNSTTSPHVINLQGTGVAGTVSASPSNLVFPLTNFGTPITLGAVLSNTTGSPITVNSVIFSGAYATDTGVGTCVNGNKVSAVTGSCVVYIKFTPAGVTNAGTATVNYTVGAGPTTGSVIITLSGAGTNPAVNVNPTSITFGATAVNTSSAAQPVTLSNPTSAAVTVSSLPSISGANASDFSLGANTCTSGFSLIATTGSCVVNVIFKPGVSGGNSRVATLSITNSSNGTLTVALSGTATQPIAGLNTSTMTFGSFDTGVTSGQQVVTLTNTGNGTLNISSVVLGGTNTGDFAQATPASGTDCRTVGTLAAAASCNVAATFTPAANGSRAATITITDNATPTTQVITLTGTGTVPAVSLAPSPMALGNQFIGTPSAQFTSVLTNSGNGPLTITSVAIDNTSGNFADFSLVTPSGVGVADCRTTTTLPALGTCTIAATFTPSAINARTATVKISDNVSGSPQLLQLTGTGTAPIASLNPAATLLFGNQIVSVKSASQVVTLTNTGSASLTIATAVIDPTSANPGDFAIVSGSGTTCTAGAVISSTNGSNSCTVTLTFTPSATGARAASLKFTDNSNATAGSVQSISLTGTGQAAPTATLAPPNVTFTSQRQGTTSTATTVTITNNGDATLAIASIALDAAGNPGDFVLTAGATTPCTLAGGNVLGHASCTFSVAFKPTATGARTATVNITDNGNATGTAGTKQTVPLSGTGTAPNAQVAATLSFGSQPINQTSTMALTLTNNGTDTLNLASSGAVAITAGTNSTLFGIGTSTCTNGLAIAPSASCTINVTFAPTAVGPSGTVTLVITDDSGAVSGTKQSVALSGTGVTASVNFSPSPVNFTPNQNVGTTSGNQTVTLTNSGGLAVQLAASNAVAISGTNASDFAIVSTGTTCINNATVGVSGGSCNVILTFTPGGSGSRTATLTVTDNANPTTQTVSLNGTGIAPIASLNPAATLLFGNQIVSVKSASQIVTLTNTGSASLTIATAVIDPTSANPGDFAIVSGSGTTCTAGAVISSTNGSNSCTVTLTFTPSATGARAASLKFTDNSNATAGSVQSISLTGTGQAAPTATLAPPNVTFTSQRQGTTSTATTVTITNNGDATLAIASIALDAAGNPGDFVLTAGATTPCTLAGGNVLGHASCTFSVAFKPTATGARTATVNITDNGNATGTAGTKQTVPLSGTGIAPSVQVMSALAFNNQPINLTATLPITLKNNGTDTLNLAATNAMAITASADSSFFGIGTSGQGTTCANSSALTAGSTCTIVVTFAPTTVRPYGPVTLVITDDAGAVSGSTQTVSINGAGVTSTVNFVPTTIPFGSQRTGVASAQMTSVLTNSAPTTLTITGVSLGGTNPGDFQLVTPSGSVTDCRTAGTVAAGATCTIAATFTPTTTGGRSATVSVVDNATGSPHSFSLTGTGTAPAVSLSSSSVTFANQIQATTSAVQTLTVTNNGTAALNISTVVLGGTNPSDFAIVTGSGTTCVGAAVGFTAPNNTCMVALTFTPATANPFTATVTFTDDASPTSQVVTLNGTGVTPPTATPTPTSLTFSSQPTTTTSAAQTITLANNGGAPLSVTSITLAGTNPGDFAFASPATTCPTSTSGQVAAGASCVLSVTFSPSAVGARTANIAIVVTGIANPAPIALTGTGTAPDLAITKSHVGSFEVGVNNTYAIKLTNNGTAATQHQITVTDTLPAGLSYVSASPPGWTCSTGAQNAQIVTCTNAGPIATTASSTLTLTVSVATTAFPGVTNTATVVDAGDSGANDKSATDAPTVVTAPDVTITATHAGDFTVGSNGTYAIKATNTGTGPTNGNIVVTDTLPSGLTFVSNTGAGWACVAGAQNAQVVTCTYTGAALAASGGNSSFTLTASVAASAFSSVTNNATVADSNDGKSTDKSAAPDATNIDNVTPTQSAFSPNLGLIAGATTPQQVTITGTGFNSSTQVTFGSSAPLNAPLTGTANAAGTSLTITVPASYLAMANAGNLTLTVTNPKNPNSNLGGGVAATTQSFPLIGLQSIAPQSGTPTPVPVVAGTPYMLQMNLSLTPSGATLPADVTITCSFPSSLAGATCTPSPSTLAHGTTATATSITINAIPTKNGSNGSSPSMPGNSGRGPLSASALGVVCTLLAMMGILFGFRQRAMQFRRAPMYLTLGILVLAAGALVGCTSNSGPAPTPTGPSTMTVTATTADGATVNTTVNITISN